MFSRTKTHFLRHIRTIIAATVLSLFSLCFFAGTEIPVAAAETFAALPYAAESYAAYCYPLHDGEEVRTGSGKGLILRSIYGKNGFFYLVFGATTESDGKLAVDRTKTVVYDGNGGLFEATGVRIGNKTTTERMIISGIETPVEIEFCGNPDFSAMWPRVDLGIDGETLVVRYFRAYVFAGKNEKNESAKKTAW